MNEFYKKPKGHHTIWASFENPECKKGGAATENFGAKGHAFNSIKAGETITLMNYQGAGIIHRFWFTFTDFLNPIILRSLVLRCYWDGSDKPAVEAPLGDFVSLGCHVIPMENELFSTAEGRSFNIYIPMPFKKSAFVTITNESDKFLQHLFYDINFTALDEPDEEALYFHAFWHRENKTKLEQDFEILPFIKGSGRYLGCAMVVNVEPEYDSWFGEGEFKAYIDGDTNPSVCGTGTEDFIGSAWGQGVFVNRYQGCTFANGDLGRFAFYRYHIVDPIYFDKDIRVTIQQLGGGDGKKIRDMYNRGKALVPVSSDSPEKGFIPFYKKYDGQDDTYDNTWVNFFREDDVAAVAYFYLDSPSNELPPIAPVEERIVDLDKTIPEKVERQDT